jgi:hypothetical protein
MSPRGRRPYGEPLSETLVLAWGDAHYARTGRWPHGDAGHIDGQPGQTWGAVNVALRRGLRGLPGGDSLARLLDRHHATRRSPARAPWTAAEDDLVRTRVAREVAERTGRSPRAVSRRRYALGIRSVHGGRAEHPSGPYQ